MDGRKDRASGARGTDRVNLEKLYQVAGESGEPIAALRAYHDRKERSKSRPGQMAADDFRGTENELHVCEGARVLLTQGLWVKA
eukprot:2569851-Pyramimonas_sp.AAC.1